MCPLNPNVVVKIIKPVVTVLKNNSRCYALTSNPYLIYVKSEFQFGTKN